MLFRSLESNNHSLLCPELKCFVSPVTDCYGCSYGFNGTCYSFKKLLKKKPEILTEVYRPILELKPLELDGEYFLVEDSILESKKVSSKDLDKKILGVTARYFSTVRFIPKFEEVNLGFKDIKFFNENTKSLGSLTTLVASCSTGDILYSLNADKRIKEILKLRRK